MFNHPEGQAHPRPPSHLKKSKRYDFGEDILGESSKVIEEFLKKENQLKDISEISLAKQVRNFIYKKSNRKNYVIEAKNYLKNKELIFSEYYDVILVGAGVHSAIYLYTVKKKNPNLKVLILEKSSEICATFCKLGDSLVLNSPTFSKVGLNSNIMQGHFIQVSDFDELFEKPFPTAKHLYELAVMTLFHADADILFDFEVENIKKAEGKYSLNFENKTINAKNVVVSNGMGGNKKNSFLKDISSQKLIAGDDFLSHCYEDKSFFEYIRDKKVAVVGAGDTANCVMEYLLPLVYPNYYYGFYREVPFFPKFVYWVGQSANNIQDYFFANKSRYCHSGGIIEFFWDEETPFELSTEIWKKTKELIRCVPEKLFSVSHKVNSLELKTENEQLEVDLVIDCTGRFNDLSTKLLKGEHTFVEGDITLYGGQWDEELGRFIVSPRFLEERRIACKLQGENIFFLGSACPLDKLIDDNEARNGSLKFQEDRTSLTNSKWSLEHTLPRTVAFADKHQEILSV
tara:strand:+ start:3251 stop:4795 length:1545 start_codon:yes stop_codon:yes gene_type:complete